MSDRDLGNRLYHANRALDIVIDEDAGHPEDAADYRTEHGEECANLIKRRLSEAQDGMCATCWSNSHFDCESCGEEFHHDDRSETHRRMCVECGARPMQRS